MTRFLHLTPLGSKNGIFDPPTDFCIKIRRYLHLTRVDTSLPLLNYWNISIGPAQICEANMQGLRLGIIIDLHLRTRKPRFESSHSDKNRVSYNGNTVFYALFFG